MVANGRQPVATSPPMRLVLTTVHPLEWPAGVERRSGCMPASFKARNVREATRELTDELARFGARSATLSHNVSEPGARGLVRDPGAAVRFTRRSARQEVEFAMGLDRYRHASDNIVALARSIEGLRTVERHGGTLVDQAIRGFLALPAPRTRPSWRELFAVSDEFDRATALDLVEGRARRMIHEAHPDRAPEAERSAAAQRVQDIKDALLAAREELRG